ncbi:MAG: tRNA glutamyl-Q(34) synthetase GluQRS [Clostridia bacterium]|nr:tRNA glutamyl-Q(34) synthetase GluQRS [Clostridia bacterium]
MVTGRFAPTPSGRLHLGNLLCCLLAWCSARKQGGRFLLRIEDVDEPRCPARLADQCIEDLRFLGFDWDGPVLYQHDRKERYQEILEQLREKGLTYPCFCTRADLHTEQAPNLGDTQYIYPGTCARLTEAEIRAKSRTRTSAIRVRVPDLEITFSDRLQGLRRENLARDCGDFVLRRSDGYFSYQLAVVADDIDSGVTEVVRGRDILSATPRQIFLYRTLGAQPPQWIHIPLLLDPQGRRLAKRDKDLDLDALSRRFSPEEILGLLACACRLQERPTATTLLSLLREFDWDRIPRESIRLPKL